jgi:hypothetical protein
LPHIQRLLFIQHFDLVEIGLDLFSAVVTGSLTYIRGIGAMVFTIGAAVVGDHH